MRFFICLDITEDIVGHPLCEFGNSTSTDTIHIDESSMIEFIDERKCIPEEITNFELEFIVIFLL